MSHLFISNKKRATSCLFSPCLVPKSVPPQKKTAPLLARSSARCHGEPLGLALSLEAPDIRKRNGAPKLPYKASWWLNQPSSKKSVKIGNVPLSRRENKRYLKPSSRFSLSYFLTFKNCSEIHPKTALFSSRQCSCAALPAATFGDGANFSLNFRWAKKRAFRQRANTHPVY